MSVARVQLEREFSCRRGVEGDAFTDKNVLKVAWNDPDKDCKKPAEEAVGHLKDLVGVK